MWIPAPLARPLALAEKEAAADGLDSGKARLWKSAVMGPWLTGLSGLALLPAAVVSLVSSGSSVLMLLAFMPFLLSMIAELLAGMSVFPHGCPPVLSREDYGDGPIQWLADRGPLPARAELLMVAVPLAALAALFAIAAGR